ncbi:Mitochondrial genome maintenance protein [Smittium culicis]|uniref:Mitochondrial genome maintenance protein MGM101 n=1 Tax=Smittium culicis TaxID=133412 RepID=A0A1R1Y615_9FUNG|nr:Mitochondrial genome maintenance protein [Smittium culicis]
MPAFKSSARCGYSSKVIKISSGASAPAVSATAEPSQPDKIAAASSNSPLSQLDSILAPLNQPESGTGHDWKVDSQYYGVSATPFDDKIVNVLLAPIEPADVEIKPDGLLYLPEIKYRRILNRAFGPGGWGLVPRGGYSTNSTVLSREYALICLGRFVSVARGEQEYFGDNNLPTATEGVKSNALMRCCKDLGIASELWDPVFIHSFKKSNCISEWVTHSTKGNKKLLWRRKDRAFDYPWVKK